MLQRLRPFLLSLTLFTLLPMSPSRAADESVKISKACDLPAMKAFAFWVGAWKVVSQVKASPTEDQWQEIKADDNIHYILDGCALQQNYQDSYIKGTSLTTYLPDKKMWQQVWIDNTMPNLISFLGEFKDGKMVMLGQATQQGKAVTNRQTYYNITADKVDYLYEQSMDGGKTFVAIIKGVYTRKL
ncbi:DUF1579 family protein [Anthocerotibacter panamensis]|uniref:DUF1579 family protein n=1 Tax=Anthocerotibacter panamensis TaxID=2857077 RepID=UPI001C405B4E|nr:DUF1579 family protein [Anthocerotibacter panamensis]